MKTRIAAVAAALSLTFSAFAQTASTKQPKPKSNKEVEAINAVFQAADDDARIAAANGLITKFADTEFKAIALFVAASAYQNKGEFENMVVFAERTLEADPKFYAVQLMLAQGFAQKTREFDFDKEEKLGKAEKYAKEAIELVKTAPKPRPDIPDAQWEVMKKDFESQGHEALAMAALVRKKNDVAVAEFKTALELQNKPDPATMVRLASAYNTAGKWDDALALLDKVKDNPDAVEAVKRVASQERVKAVMGKQKAAAPAAPPAAAPKP